MIALVEAIAKLEAKLAARDALILTLVETVLGPATAEEAKRLVARKDAEIESWKAS